ncbi:hypothetical protein [Hyphobacterium marinum]|uniref:DUF2834 domain-containing protein n=1 Tax=Hyphobacterium marinum TaxID=3116574 RepID=A0ABU7LVM1_9PROT|nr:hypothetical protein [Hyphobacterium sp. Y6023]MEE2565611.1 hypothetical protein [Hyphobacterium sp. Y6023]
MAILRSLLGLAALAFAALIAWAVNAGNFGEAGGWLTSDPWGIVTLTDLYIGFALIAVVIALFERSAWRSAVWIVPLPFLGNLWALVWLAFVLPKLTQRLRASA